MTLGNLTFNSGSGRFIMPVDGADVLALNGLSLNANGAIDIEDNSLIIHNADNATAATTLRRQSRGAGRR